MSQKITNIDSKGIT